MRKIVLALFTFFHSLTGTATSRDGGSGILPSSLMFISMTTTGLGSKSLTVPPVKVTNATVDQLYSDQVIPTSQRSCHEKMRTSGRVIDACVLLQLTRETEFQFDYYYTAKEVEEGALRYI